MAPLAFILGGISGTFSALLSWALFGFGLWGMLQVYFIVGLGVAVVLITTALLRSNGADKGRTTAKSGHLQRA